MDARTHNRSTASREEDWRDRLLPLMALVLVASGLVFVAFSFFELRDFYARVEHAPFDLSENFAAFEERAAPGEADSLDYLRFTTMARLEADALQRRYHQATTTMLARVWTRQLGFLTGMILALVGAAFVLGRLRDPGSTLSGEASGVKGAIATSSPGLVLAALGAGLMAITLTVPFGVETFDRTVYFEPSPDAPTGPSPVTQPPGSAGGITVLPEDPGPPPQLP